MSSTKPQTQRSGCSQPLPAATCLHDLPLASRAGWLAELDGQFQQALPADLAGQVHLANLRARCALLMTASPAWATRVRLQQAQIRQILQAMGQPVESLIVNVVPPERPTSAGAHTTPLTPAAAEHLRRAADSMPHPELRERLLALASLAGDRKE